MWMCSFSTRTENVVYLIWI